MRDLLVTTIVFGALPFIIRRPVYGILLWTWLSLMSPHRLTWSYAYDMPFAQIVAIVVLLSLLGWKEPKKIPWSPLTVTWALFVFWMCVSTMFAFNFENSLEGLEKSMKIQLFCFITLMVITTKERLNLFVWVVALSIAFFGIKGGIHTIRGGGAHLVFGPPGSYIAGNNELAMALIVILPLLRFQQLQTKNKWIFHGLTLAMILCAFSIIGSNSRGAFLALIAMGGFLVLKSRKRAVMIVLLIVLVPVGVAFAPQKYWDRMSTIQTYESDASAMGRINAWSTAINIANANPLTGGGFHAFTPQAFAVYSPTPGLSRDVHSIYFEVLGELGWVGLVLFLSLLLMTYRIAGRTVRKARIVSEGSWHADLARMAQVCLVGYGVGGAFLGLAYYDLLYDIIAIVFLNHLILDRLLQERPELAPTGSPGLINGVGSLPTYGHANKPVTGRD